MNFWYLKTSSQKIVCRATSNSFFLQYLHSVTTLFALSYFRKQTLLCAHSFRFIVDVLNNLLVTSTAMFLDIFNANITLKTVQLKYNN